MNHLEEARKIFKLASDVGAASELSYGEYALLGGMIAIAETQVERNNIECFKLARLEDIAEQLERICTSSDCNHRWVVESAIEPRTEYCSKCGIWRKEDK